MKKIIFSLVLVLSLLFNIVIVGTVLVFLNTNLLDGPALFISMDTYLQRICRDEVFPQALERPETKEFGIYIFCKEIEGRARPPVATEGELISPEQVDPEVEDSREATSESDAEDGLLIGDSDEPTSQPDTSDEDETTEIIQIISAWCEEYDAPECLPVTSYSVVDLDDKHAVVKIGGSNYLLTKKDNEWNVSIASQENNICDTGSGSLDLIEYCSR